VVPAALSSVMIRLLYGYMHKKILEFKAARDNKDWISRLEKRISKYLENRKRLSKLNKKITNYLESKNSRRVLFLLTIVAIDSAIPDIIAIGIVRKKLPFPLFILAAIIGKCTVYLPVIRLGK
jgi:membrane protein YqaA with SNARE-associated domain